MKIIIFIGLAALIAAACGVFVPPRPGHHKRVTALGEKECSYGPSFWCKNLTAAAGCKAVKHCIQTVWNHLELPEDKTTICQTCLDMVKQARDQLLSNETQEEIKEVFEGTCALIHLKPIVRECDKIADDYIPELVDTLASQMNPQVVCSVAGLCNSEKIHRLLIEAGELPATKKASSCENCHTVVDFAEEKFKKSSRDDVLNGFLQACGRLGSFADACSDIIVTYFTDIYHHIQENFNSNEVCLMAGECSAQFHRHAKVEITPQSHIGYVPVEPKDDLPCELCEQLVTHLRDLLVTNTTEDEFKMVLQGLCKQTGNFKQECLTLVDQYYSLIYTFMVSELNSTVVCGMIGICPNNNKNVYIAPLLSVDSAVKIMKKPTLSLAQQAQLPIELLMPPHAQFLYNRETCVFCQYFLHYVQEALTDPKTEDGIKHVIDKACERLPAAINNTCVNFVDAYGQAFIALLVQDIDPSQICPLIKVCPAENSQEVDVFMQQPSSSKCPLCLYAVTQVESMVKDKKTEANIKSALGKLCSHFSKNLATECNDFVNTYSNELIEMLVADFKPSEVCVYLKLCDDQSPKLKSLPSPVIKVLYGGDVDTNIIPDNTVNGQPIIDIQLQDSTKPTCVLCEFVMKEIEDQLKDTTNEDEIKKVVHGICNKMPKSIRSECNGFVNQYADVVIQLLIQALEPSDICSYIHLCASKIQQAQGEILECVVCEVTVIAIEKILANPKADHSVEHVLEKACRALPRKYINKCTSIIEEYGDMIINMITSNVPAKVICSNIELCSEPPKSQLGTEKCTYGPSYWCESHENANACGIGAMTHCQLKVWKNGKPAQELLGSNKCTYGPSYWCESHEIANGCGLGALTHCQLKVWKNGRPNQKLIGANKCTFGPGYWCASPENANECGAGAQKHCEEKVWSKKRTEREVTRVGTNKCTFGPSYWCESPENADSCPGARKHCEEKVWNQKRTRREETRPGASKCSYGPSYWCESPENADSCPGARKHCEENVWNQKRTRREVTRVGTNKCTFGPSYWCESPENADSCPGTRKHCEEKVWNKKRTEREVTRVGTNKCTFGPSYWCESPENADSCPGARKHCEEKVWNQKRT